MNKLKQSRAASFIVVTVVYIIATIVGVLIYRALSLTEIEPNWFETANSLMCCVQKA